MMENHPKQSLTSVFQAFQSGDDHDFNVTEIKVELSKLGSEVYISRSQAKRILRGLEAFDVIFLDFDGIRVVGQGFVDEVFRVFQNQHPEKEIKYVNANDDVVFMIRISF